MSPDRQILRLMAAMILAIIAYVAPSAVQAHEGHPHHGHATTAAPPAVSTEAPAWSRAARAVVEAARIAPTEDGCCRPGCKTRCRGTMACCATGVLANPLGLLPTVFRGSPLVPDDVAGTAGLGPEALPKPPRTRA